MRWIALPLLCVFAAPRAHAAESLDACTGYIDVLPATLGTQGTWCLRKDLVSKLSSGVAITIGTENVTIDCNGYKIGGLAAGPASQAVAIAATSSIFAPDTGRHATVRHCNIRGFLTGIRIDESAHALVEDNRFDGNYRVAIYVAGDGGIVRRNRVFDTGLDSGGGPGPGAGIFAGGSVLVADNLVDGLSGNAATGIWVVPALVADDISVVARNHIRNFASGGTGIYIEHGRALAHDNIVFGPADYALQCQNFQPTTRGNVLTGHFFPAAIDGCVDVDNVVNPD